MSQRFNGLTCQRAKMRFTLLKRTTNIEIDVFEYICINISSAKKFVTDLAWQKGGGGVSHKKHFWSPWSWENICQPKRPGDNLEPEPRAFSHTPD